MWRIQVARLVQLSTCESISITTLLISSPLYCNLQSTVKHKPYQKQARIKACCQQHVGDRISLYLLGRRKKKYFLSKQLTQDSCFNAKSQHEACFCLGSKSQDKRQGEWYTGIEYFDCPGTVLQFYYYLFQPGEDSWYFTERTLLLQGMYSLPHQQQLELLFLNRPEVLTQGQQEGAALAS